MVYSASHHALYLTATAAKEKEEKKQAAVKLLQNKSPRGFPGGTTGTRGNDRDGKRSFPGGTTGTESAAANSSAAPAHQTVPGAQQFATTGTFPTAVGGGQGLFPQQFSTPTFAFPWAAAGGAMMLPQNNFLVNQGAAMMVPGSAAAPDQCAVLQHPACGPGLMPADGPAGIMPAAGMMPVKTMTDDETQKIMLTMQNLAAMQQNIGAMQVVMTSNNLPPTAANMQAMAGMLAANGMLINCSGSVGVGGGGVVSGGAGMVGGNVGVVENGAGVNGREQLPLSVAVDGSGNIPMDQTAMLSAPVAQPGPPGGGCHEQQVDASSGSAGEVQFQMEAGASCGGAWGKSGGGGLGWGPPDQQYSDGSWTWSDQNFCKGSYNTSWNGGYNGLGHTGPG